MDILESALRKRVASQIREALEWMDQGPLTQKFNNFCNLLESNQELKPDEVRRHMLLAGYNPNPEAISRPGSKEIEYEVSNLGLYEDLN